MMMSALRVQPARRLVWSPCVDADDHIVQMSFLVRSSNLPILRDCKAVLSINRPEA